VTAFSALAFGGIRIFESHYLTERRQVRFPKTKKKRIRAKWAKRASSYAEMPLDYFFMDRKAGIVYAHPVTAARIREKVAAIEAGKL
jgi:hypothetical protein